MNDLIINYDMFERIKHVDELIINLFRIFQTQQKLQKDNIKM